MPPRKAAAPKAASTTRSALQNLVTGDAVDVKVAGTADVVTGPAAPGGEAPGAPATEAVNTPAPAVTIPQENITSTAPTADVVAVVAAPPVDADPAVTVGGPVVDPDVATPEEVADALGHASIDRVSALAALTSPAPGGAEVTLTVETPPYVSGREYDWTNGNTDVESVTVLVTGTMLTSGFRSAARGDKVTLAKSTGDKFVTIGTAVKA